MQHQNSVFRSIGFGSLEFPANTKYVYNICKMLVQHCANAIQMFCAYYSTGLSLTPVFFHLKLELFKRLINLLIF